MWGGLAWIGCCGELVLHKLTRYRINLPIRFFSYGKWLSIKKPFTAISEMSTPTTLWPASASLCISKERWMWVCDITHADLTLPMLIASQLQSDFSAGYSANWKSVTYVSAYQLRLLPGHALISKAHTRRWMHACMYVQVITYIQVIAFMVVTCVRYVYTYQSISSVLPQNGTMIRSRLSLPPSLSSKAGKWLMRVLYYTRDRQKTNICHYISIQNGRVTRYITDGKREHDVYVHASRLKMFLYT